MRKNERYDYAKLIFSVVTFEVLKLVDEYYNCMICNSINN